MFAVGVLQGVYAALHFVFFHVERDGFHARLVMYCGFREDGDKIAVPDEFQEDVHFVQFHPHFEVVGTLGKHLVERVAGLQPFAGHGELVAFQFVGADFLFAGQLVVGTYHDRQMVVEQDMRLDLFVTARGFEGQDEVHFPFDEHLHQFRHGFVVDVQLHFRVLFHEREHGLRQDGAERVGHADVQRTGEQLLQVADVLLAGVGGIQSFLGVGEQFRTRFRERHFVAVALEELHVEFCFQLPDLLREGALGDEEPFGRFGEIECLGGFDEVFELSEFHVVLTCGFE